MRKDPLAFERSEHEISDGRKLYRYTFAPEEGPSAENDPKVFSNDVESAEESAPE